MCIKHTMKSEFTRIHMVPCVQIVNFNSCSMILNKEIEEHILLAVMSPSWNFLAGAEPDGGTLIFELKPS